MKRSAHAVWKGTGKDGKGYVSSDSKVLDKTAYSYKTRFEDGKGTNPEELIAAAHASCFAMKLSFNITEAGFEPNELDASCAIHLEEGKITKSHITLKAKVDGMDESKFGELVADAEKNCPISVLLNCAIKVDFTLN